MESGHPHAVFLARLTAGATHEVRNVLAIVKESAGLVDDLVTLAGPGGHPDPERIREALARIEVQVGRAADLLTSMNRVAHGIDRHEERVDLGEACEHVVRLCRRFAGQRKRHLEFREPAVAATVVAGALDVYRALAVALGVAVEQAREGATVVVEIVGEGSPAVRLRFSADLSDDSRTEGMDTAANAYLERLREELEGLPARVRDGDAPGSFTLVFV
jgi:hypothetical protein